MPDPIRDDEIELYIATNSILSGERALLVGQAFLAFTRAHEGIGDEAEIEIVHLGRGSFAARLRVIFADPLFIGGSILVGLAMQAVQTLRTESGGFSDEVAIACIESGASYCQIRTGETELTVGRHEMPAVSAWMERQEAGELPGPAQQSEVTPTGAEATKPRLGEQRTLRGHFSTAGAESRGLGAMLFHPVNRSGAPRAHQVVARPTLLREVPEKERVEIEAFPIEGVSDTLWVTAWRPVDESESAKPEPGNTLNTLRHLLLYPTGRESRGEPVFQTRAGEQFVLRNTKGKARTYRNSAVRVAGRGVIDATLRDGLTALDVTMIEPLKPKPGS